MYATGLLKSQKNIGRFSGGMGLSLMGLPPIKGTAVSARCWLEELDSGAAGSCQRLSDGPSRSGHCVRSIFRVYIDVSSSGSTLPAVALSTVRK